MQLSSWGFVILAYSMFYISVSFLWLLQFLAFSSYSIYNLLSATLMNWRLKSSFSLSLTWISTIFHLGELIKAGESFGKNHFRNLFHLPTFFLQSYWSFWELRSICPSSQTPDSWAQVTHRSQDLLLPYCQIRVEHKHRKGTLSYRLTLASIGTQGKPAEAESSVSCMALLQLGLECPSS